MKTLFMSVHYPEQVGLATVYAETIPFLQALVIKNNYKNVSCRSIATTDERNKITANLAVERVCVKLYEKVLLVEREL